MKDPMVEAKLATPVDPLDAPRPRGVRAANAFRLAAWVLFAISIGAETIGVARANRAALVHTLPDDAFYYAEIGRRIAAGQGATFDGLHRTNGFHPLWQLLVAGLALVLRGDALLRAILLGELAAATAGLLVIYRELKAVVGREAAVLAVLVAAHSTLTLGSVVNGMESGVVVLAFAATVTFTRRFLERPSVRTAALLGAATGVLVLARVDLVAVAWVPAVLVVWAVRQVHVVAAFVGAALGSVLPWVVWSVWWAGHVLPVSGSLKLHELGTTMNARFGGRFTSGYVSFTAHLAVHYVRVLELGTGAELGGGRLTSALGHGLLVALAFGGLVLGASRWWDRGLRRRLGPGGIALVSVLTMVVLKAILDLVLLPYWALAWYSAPVRIAAACVVGVGAWMLVTALRAGHGTVAVAVSALVLLLAFPQNIGAIGATSSDRLVPGRWQDTDVVAVKWVRTSPVRGVFGSTDAGLLGYYLHPVPVVDLDGLVNDYSYASSLERGTSWNALYKTEGLAYLIERTQPGSPDAPPCARVLWTSPNGIPYGGGPDQSKVDVIALHVFDVTSCLH